MNDDIEPNPRNADKRPLHEAVEQKHNEVVQIFLADERIDVNALDGVRSIIILFAIFGSSFISIFRTALHHAADKGDKVIVQLLLAKDGINPNLRDVLIVAFRDVRFLNSEFFFGFLATFLLRLAARTYGIGRFAVAKACAEVESMIARIEFSELIKCVINFLPDFCCGQK
jgi:hypothetical protein